MSRSTETSSPPPTPPPAMECGILSTPRITLNGTQVFIKIAFCFTLLGCLVAVCLYIDSYADKIKVELDRIEHF